MNQKKIDRIYTKYLVKNPITFITLVVAGSIAFLYLSLTINIDIMKLYDAELIKVDQEYIAIPKECAVYEGVRQMYIYSDRNEVILKTDVVFDKTSGYKIINKNAALDGMQGKVTIEIPSRQVSLLYNVFIMGGKLSEN